MIPPLDLADLLPAVRDRGFVEVRSGPGLAIDLRYAKPDNFLGHAVYGGFDRLMLHPIAAGKLEAAVALAGTLAPGYDLVVFDGLRPNRIQRLMWQAVRGTPQQPYVGDPAIGSIHGYGLAVDVSLRRPDGQPCDMGTGFDDFSVLSEPRREGAHLAAGALEPSHIENRRRLRALMTRAGFHPIAIEWWHFDALPPGDVRRDFELIE